MKLTHTRADLLKQIAALNIVAKIPLKITNITSKYIKKALNQLETDEYVTKIAENQYIITVKGALALLEKGSVPLVTAEMLQRYIDQYEQMLVDYREKRTL